MSSIHSRVWRAAGLVTVAALLLAGSTAYFVIQDDLTDDLDISLVEQAHLLAEQVTQVEGGSTEFLGMLTTEKGRGFVITDRQGKVLAQGGDPDLVHVTTAPSELPHSAVTRTDNEVRIAQLTLPAASGSTQTSTTLVEITVSQDLDRLDGNLTAIAIALLAACLGVSALVAIILGRVTQRALRPVTVLSATIAGIDPQRLPAAVAIAEAPVELQPIITQLDALLARLAATMAHDRAFSAAAAHELRTPLAGLRTTFEVALARDRDATSLRDFVLAGQAIVMQMDHMVAGLLLLARTDSGRAVPVLQRMDLVAVIRDALPTLVTAAERSGRAIDLSLPVIAMGLSESTLALVMVRTLFDNALAHGSAEAPIRITLEAAPRSADGHPWWVLTIANPGCRITEADVPQVFDRFWRGDQARSADDGHSGLGLAICRSAAQALGCKVWVSVAGGWFTATVELPASHTEGSSLAMI